MSQLTATRQRSILTSNLKGAKLPFTYSHANLCEMTPEEQKEQEDRVAKVKQAVAQWASRTPEEKRRDDERGRAELAWIKQRFAHTDKLEKLLDQLFDDISPSDEPYFIKKHEAIRKAIWQELHRFFKGNLIYDRTSIRAKLMDVIQTACEQGGVELEVKFVDRLLKGIQKKGEMTIYHPAFAEGFITYIQSKPLYEIRHELNRVFDEQATDPPSDLWYLAEVFMDNKLSGWDKQKRFAIAEWFETKKQDIDAAEANPIEIGEVEHQAESEQEPLDLTLGSVLEPTLELRQIAMLYYDQGRTISGNASDIAAAHKRKGKRSGNKLQSFWNEDANPKGIKKTRSQRAATKLIKTIEAIIPLLDSSQAEKAKSDIETIKESVTKDD